MAHLTPFQKRRQRVRTALRPRAAGRPRMSVHRSGRHLYAQLIDDAAGKTLAAASTLAKHVRGQTGANAAATAAFAQHPTPHPTTPAVPRAVLCRCGLLFTGGP